MVSIILTLQVTLSGGYINTPPTHIRIEFSEYLIARIQKMQQIINCDGYDTISEYNGEPQYLIKDNHGVYKKSAYTFEAEMLHVSATYFYWQSNIKFSDVSVRSNGVHYEDFNKILIVRKLPIIEMPKYINEKNPIIQHLAKIRLESND
jgi:hypothetical protein